MKIVNGAIELEQCERPGSIGDSFPESARYEHVKQLGGDYKLECNFDQFITPFGYVRHPDVPDDWKEKDTSSDVLTVPFLMFRRMCDPRADEMKRRLKANGFRTGNGDLLSPGLFAEMYAPILRTPLLLVQLALFKFKYRWNDEKHKFEENEESSCDYINFIHVAAYAPKWLRRLINPVTLIDKIINYYRNEPNCLFLKSEYVEVCFKYFGENAK